MTLMSYYHLREMTGGDVEKIEELFEIMYPERKLPLRYWKWLFQCPTGHESQGVFFHDKLVACYSALYHDQTALCVSAMVHPKHRKKGLFSKIARTLYEKIAQKVNYLHLFSNQAILPIHLKYFNFIPTDPIIEYRKNIEQEQISLIPYCTGNFNLDWFAHWRYVEHPTKQYYFHDLGTNYVVLNSYENRTQIIDFDHWDLAVYQVALAHAKKNNNSIIATWCEHDIEDFEKIQLSTWHLHKKLNKFISHDLLKDLLPTKLRMGYSDVF